MGGNADQLHDIQECSGIYKSLFERSVLKRKKNKSEHEIGRFTPSDWSKSQSEAQEAGWARFSISLCLIYFLLNKTSKQKSINEQHKQAQATAKTMAASTATNAPETRQPEDREQKIHEQHAADDSQCSFHHRSHTRGPWGRPSLNCVLPYIPKPSVVASDDAA